MRKNVCSLYEEGVYYNVYEQDGYFIKENVETGEQFYISLDDYESYQIAGALNDAILAKKGIINDYYAYGDNQDLGNSQDFEEEQVEEVIDEVIIPEESHTLDSADLEDEAELSLIDAIKTSALNNEDASVDEDEKTLRELEAIIDARIEKKKNESVHRITVNEDLEESLEAEPDEFTLVGLGEDGTFADEDEEELGGVFSGNYEPKFDDDNEFYFPELNGIPKKEGFLHRIIKSRRSKKKAKIKVDKVKPEKVKKEKKVKEKKVKQPKEKKIKEPKIKKEKQPKEKKQKIKRVKEARPYKDKKKLGASTKLAIIAACALGVAVLASGAQKMYNTYKENLGISFEFNESEARMDTIKNTFKTVLDENKTITEDLRQDLIYYLNILYSYSLSDDTYKSILNNINKYDFTDKLSLSVAELNDILAGNPNSYMIAHQLYNYKNGISRSTITKYQWVADVLSLSDDATKLLLDGEDINEILSAVYGIDETLDLSLSAFLNGEGNNIKMYIDELKTKSFGSVTDSCELENNIFNPYIKIYDKNVGCYLYFDKTTRKGISEAVYSQMLDSMLSTRVDDLDYTNVKDRELLYFYANALLDTNNMDATNMTDLIMKGLSTNYHVFDIFDLMRYMSGSEVSHERAAYLYSLITYGDDAIPLLQEINMCLKIDVEEGYISENMYNGFIEHLNLGMDIYAPEMKDAFNEASENNEHMDGYTLKIFGGVNL